MNRLFEAIDSQKFFTLNEAKVTDYIDADHLGEIIINNPILKTFKDCEPIESMTLKMTGDMGISYYKVIKNDDGEFEAYLISKDGRQLGDPFLLENNKLGESKEVFKPLKFKDTGEGFEIATRKGITFEIFYEEDDDEPYKAQVESGYGSEYDTFDEWVYDYDESFKTHEEAINYLNNVCKEILSEKKNNSDINE